MTAWFVNSSKINIIPFFLNKQYFPKGYDLFSSIPKVIAFLIESILLVSTINLSTINSIGSIG